MVRALSDIWDGEVCTGVIGFELWTVYARSVQRCVQSLLGHLRWDFSQMRPQMPQLSEKKVIFLRYVAKVV